MPKALLSHAGGFKICWSSDDRTSGVSHDFRIALSPPLDLSSADRWEMCLEDLATWYTWFNVSADYGTNLFKYSVDSGANWKTITLSDGIYKAADLISAISAGITANGDDPTNLVIVANQNTQKFEFTFSGGYQVDFTGMAIRTLMGANSAVYSVSGPMPNVAAMTNSVNTWLLHCDLLNGGYAGRYQGQVLYQFTPDVAPGGSIQRSPQLTYSLVRSAQSVSDVRFWLTDQQLRPININGEPLTVSLHFRPLKYS